MKKIFIILIASVFVTALLPINSVTAEDAAPVVIVENQQVVSDESVIAGEAVEAVISNLDNSLVELNGVTSNPPKNVPSSLGMFWQNVKENVSLTLTFNPVKKAEKQIAYAQQRIEQANYILTSSANEKDQEKAQKIIEKANAFIEKAQEKKEYFINNPTEATNRIAENIARLELNTQRIMDKLEDTIPADKLAKVEALQAKIDERQQRFFENYLNNPNISEEQKAKITAVKEEVAVKLQERLLEKEEYKGLLDKAKSGDQEAREELNAIRKEKAEAVKEEIKALKERKQEVINQLKDGSIDVSEEFPGVSKEVLDKLQINVNRQILNHLETQSQILEKEKERAQNAVEAGNTDAQKRVNNIIQQQERIEEKQTNIQQKQEQVRQQIKENRQQEDLPLLKPKAPNPSIKPLPISETGN